MSDVKLYQVKVERGSDGWWAITVPDLPGVFSQCRRFREAEGQARDAIALFLDVPVESISVLPTPVLGNVLEKKIRERRDLVQRVDDVQHELALVSVDLLRDMADTGMTQRDAADALGISFQRVGQLWPRGARRPSPNRRSASG